MAHVTGLSPGLAWNAIVGQLGRPDRRWPKHEGHLQYRDRFKLCAFLVANEVPQGLIRKLAHTNQITLRDKKARYEWDRLAVLLCNNEEKRGTYKSHKLGVGTVYLNGTLVEPLTPPPRRAVTLINLL